MRLLPRHDRFLSLALLATTCLFLLRMNDGWDDSTRDPVGGNDKTQAPISIESLCAYMTPNFTIAATHAQRSAVWEPTTCDATSMAPGRACMFYTAGRWLQPLRPRLVGATTQDRSVNSGEAQGYDIAQGKPACSLAQALSEVTACTMHENRTLRLSSSACGLPANDDAALRALLWKLTGARRSPQGDDTTLPFSMLLRGNSLLRSMLYGLIRMLRGLEVGSDRATHASIVYIATTVGDIVFILKDKEAASADDARRAAESLLGGDIVLYVDYAFVCTDTQAVLDAVNPYRVLGSAALLYRCDYEPIPALPYQHRRQLAAVQGRLHMVARHAKLILFEGPMQHHRFCWDTRCAAPDARLSLRYELQRRLLLSETTGTSSGASNGTQQRVGLIPQGELMTRCGLAPRDGIHTESVLAPWFPAPASPSKGQPLGSDYPTFAHLMWHLVSLLTFDNANEDTS